MNINENRRGRHQSTTDVAWHVLVPAGLLTVFFESRFTNMRMGLAAHLEGVMNGIFLVALGAV